MKRYRITYERTKYTNAPGDVQKVTFEMTLEPEYDASNRAYLELCKITLFPENWQETECAEVVS